MVSTTKSDRNHGKQFETEEGEAEGLPSRRINEDHHRELNKPYWQLAETEAEGRQGQGQTGELHRYQLSVKGYAPGIYSRARVAQF